MKRRIEPASIADLIEVARVLGPLRAGVVFTGGAVVPLLVTDPAAPPTRATYDVDLLLAGATRKSYHDVEARLRANRFTQDPSSPLICRWSRGRLDVDVMPTMSESLDSRTAGTAWPPSARRSIASTTSTSG